jgi:hypothetical protein
MVTLTRTVNPRRDFDVIDAATGEVVMAVRHLWPEETVECCMCPQQADHSFAVPYYCGPVLEGHSEGGYKVACAWCYARWEAWSNATLAKLASQGERP